MDSQADRRIDGVVIGAVDETPFSTSPILFFMSANVGSDAALMELAILKAQKKEPVAFTCHSLHSAVPNLSTICARSACPFWDQVESDMTQEYSPTTTSTAPQSGLKWPRAKRQTV
jgi:hypothetical protein